MQFQIGGGCGLNAGLSVSYTNYQTPPQTTSATNLKLHTNQWRILRYTAYTGGIPNFGGLKTLMNCVSSQKKVIRF